MMNSMLVNFISCLNLQNKILNSLWAEVQPGQKMYDKS